MKELPLSFPFPPFFFIFFFFHIAFWTPYPWSICKHRKLWRWAMAARERIFSGILNFPCHKRSALLLPRATEHNVVSTKLGSYDPLSPGTPRLLLPLTGIDNVCSLRFHPSQRQTQTNSRLACSCEGGVSIRAGF